VPFVRACKSLIPLLAIAGALVVHAGATRTHRAPTASHAKTSKKKPAAHKIRGQRQIDPDRAREIQTALIREHYLTGEPTGQWDSSSQAAMSKFQADQGWQTKLTPDSRALIKLGLGPSHDAPRTSPVTQTSSPIPSEATQSAFSPANHAAREDSASQ
jgi:peptidoglycan hydrolase-like protein with peptidoglycan-binding domain